MQDVTTTKGTRMFIFESLAEADRFTDNKLFSPVPESFAGEDLPAWDNVESMLTKPWEEGMKVLEQFINRLRDSDLPEVKETRRRTRFDDSEGDEVDMDRLRSGQSFWRRSMREDSTGPNEVTIITDLTAAASRDPRNILWRGAAALALTVLLEERGYSVELWVLDAGTLFASESTTVVNAINLKRCEEPLDTSTLVNAVSGWYFRTAFFTLMRSVCKHAKKACSPTLGSVRVATADDLDQISRDANRIFSSGVFSFDSAVAMLQAELENVCRNKVC